MTEDEPLQPSLGHDVVSAVEIDPRASDETLLKRALDQGRGRGPCVKAEASALCAAASRTAPSGRDCAPLRPNASGGHPVRARSRGRSGSGPSIGRGDGSRRKGAGRNTQETVPTLIGRCIMQPGRWTHIVVPTRGALALSSWMLFVASLSFFILAGQSFVKERSSGGLVLLVSVLCLAISMRIDLRLWAEDFTSRLEALIEQAVVDRTTTPGSGPCR